MNEPVYLGVYWRARPESIECCALRAEHALHLLVDCDPSLSNWYQQGPTLEEARERRFPREAALLQEVFRRQEQQEGRMTGEGFSLGLWSGEPTEPGPVLSLYCGDASPHVSNSCVLTLPEEGLIAARLHSPAMLLQTLRAMVLAWEPEWGLATSHEWRDLVLEPATGGTFIGWLTYLSHRRGPLPPLPPSVHIEPVEDLGSLLLLTPERFSISNPAHLALAHDVTERLGRVGLLTPLAPLE